MADRVNHAEPVRRMRGRGSFIAFFLALGLLAQTAPLVASTPRDELLRLVPDAIGFCFLVQDLRGQATAVQNSLFADNLSRSPLGAKIRASDDLKKLDRFEAKLKDTLGVGWTQLRDDILGDAVVLAYRPGPPGKPDQEQGLLMLRARDAKILIDLIERVNKVQKDEGDLKELEKLQHKGIVYYRRLTFDKRAGSDKPPEYYFVKGPILVMSSQEAMLREAIDCDRMRAADAVPMVTQRFRELDADNALMALWINPRAFDDEVNAKIASAPAQRVAPIKHFARYWKALDSMVLSLAPVRQDFNLSLGIRARSKELPSAAQSLFREAAASSELWRRFPESALLAIGGRFDGSAFLHVLDGFLSDEDRKALHAALNRQLTTLLDEEDFTRDLLPGLGPDWGLCVIAPKSGEKGWIPQTLFALRVDTRRAKKSLERKLTGALDFAARLAILGHNSQNPDHPIKLKTMEMDEQEIRYLSSESGLPSGLTPAYGVLKGYLLVSSSLENLKSFARSTLSPAPSSDAPTPLLRISLNDWRIYLKDHREAIVAYFADKNQTSTDSVGQQVDSVIAALQFIDRIELRQRTATDKAIFTLSVQLAQPLGK